MAHKAEKTAQPHILLVRREIEALLPSPMDTITPVMPRTEAQWLDAEKWPRQGHGWRYVRKAGNVYFQFEEPLTWEAVTQAMYRGMVAGGITAEQSPFVSKIEGKPHPRIAKGDDIGENMEGHKKGDIIMGASRMLVETTKMGCYSWNLPAGPLRFGGACPGANMAFDVAHVAEIDPMAPVRIKNAVRRSRTYAAGKYSMAIPSTRKEIAERFICNGCYAMKGSYGNQSVLCAMAWKKMWLRGFALPTGQFVDAMVGAIQLSRNKLRQRRNKASGPRELAAIPHPDFFRIHDSGDFFSREYLEAWFDVCRALPDVHFWAPSRVWTTSAMARDMERIIAQGKLPKNLALRPSGLFFDGPEPKVPGYSGGTSSTTITFNTKSGRIHMDIASTSDDTWGCPAYLPEIIGGGAEPVMQSEKDTLEFEAKRDFGAKVSLTGKKGGYKLFVPPRTTLKATTIPRMREKYETLKKRRNNPVDKQSYAMYPPVDDATLEDPRYVFYDAMFDPKADSFIVDTHTGRPMTATKQNRKAYPGAIVKKAQSYQAAGSCSVARDPKQAAECRVCWGTTDHKQSKTMKHLPVVYGKH